LPMLITPEKQKGGGEEELMIAPYLAAKRADKKRVKVQKDNPDQKVG